MEEEAERLYYESLARFHQLVGDQTTSNAVLNRVGRMTWGTKWAGVFPADHAPKLDGRRSYAIINTDPVGEPGEHWMAYVWADDRPLIYDSFGRNARTITRGELPKKLREADRDAEQVDAEKDCGARCLAFIAVAHEKGWRVAATI